MGRLNKQTLSKVTCRSSLGSKFLRLLIWSITEYIFSSLWGHKNPLRHYSSKCSLMFSVWQNSACVTEQCLCDRSVPLWQNSACVTEQCQCERTVMGWPGDRGVKHRVPPGIPFIGSSYSRKAPKQSLRLWHRLNNNGNNSMISLNLNRRIYSIYRLYQLLLNIIWYWSHVNWVLCVYLLPPVHLTSWY